MTADPPSWAARLREERCKRGWSQRQMALRIYRAADERVQAGLPRVEHLSRPSNRPCPPRSHATWVR
jgi:hypothetical protein